MKKVLCLQPGCGRYVKKNASRFCSNRCQFAFQYVEYIRKWKSGEIEGSKGTHDGPSTRIRRYLMECSGHKCQICSWGERNPKTGRIPLHVDHIDGNARNNRPDNLRLLCPNHHALTETFGASNKGHGRAVRRARYRKGIDATRFSPLILPKRRVRYGW